MTCELAVIVPTLNEKDNVEVLLQRLKIALGDVTWEVIFVDDDSKDGTTELIQKIASRDPQVRCLHRIGRRGLSSACIEGMLATSAPFLAVIDADLQHDKTLLPKMLERLKAGSSEVVIASRFTEGGGIGNWSAKRTMISQTAAWLSRLVVKSDLTDPMSGFFMLRRETFREAVRNMSGRGYKILLDMFASMGRPVTFEELPYQFKERNAGESKLGALVIWEYLLLLADKLFGGWLPVRFAMFVFVGGLGILVHLLILGLGIEVLGIPFIPSQISAIAVAMTSNFFLNNLFTYRDFRVTGVGIIRGLISFYFACGVGGLVNFAFATFVFEQGVAWWIAGILGAAIGSVWNFAITSTYTWNAN